MYVITLDGTPVHGGGDQEMTVIDPVLEMKLDSAGTLSMTVPPGNFGYGNIVPSKTVIQVFDDTEILWTGRVISTVSNFRKMVDITAESTLAYLNDSIVRPFDSITDVNTLVNFVIDSHNEQVDSWKWFTVGSVTVTSPPGVDLCKDLNGYRTSRNILDEVKQKCGGYFLARYQEGIHYLDYILNPGEESSQQIHFGRNLLDVTRGAKGEMVKTLVIPLGEKIEGTDERLTIASVNDGNDYLIDETASAIYGKISTIVNHDGVANPAQLKNLGEQDLQRLSALPLTIVATAIDLSLVDKQISSFKVGDFVHIVSPPHAIDETLQVTAIRLDLAKPDASEITLGVPEESFIERSI